MNINPFVPNALFFYHLKTSEYFQGVEKGCIGNKWVNMWILAAIITNLRHCVRCVQIWSFFWSVFSPNAVQYGPEKTPYLDTFTKCEFHQLQVPTSLIRQSNTYINKPYMSNEGHCKNYLWFHFSFWLGRMKIKLLFTSKSQFPIT